MDYIYVFDENDNKKKMEVVSTFKLENLPDKYIIYSELDRSHYYIGKYKDGSDELITDLSEKELELCNSIFKEVMKNAA